MSIKHYWVPFGVLCLLFLAGILFVFYGKHKNKNTPSSVCIYQQIDFFWRTRQFSKVDSCIKEMSTELSNYIPVEIMIAIYSYKNGAQVEKTIELFKKIQETMGTNMALFSPLFEEKLESEKEEYESLNALYQKKHISPERRMEERNIFHQTQFKHSKRWGSEDLFFNAPEVFVTNNLVVPVKSLRTLAPSPSLMSKTEKELKLIICGDNTTIVERKAAVLALVSRRRAEGGLPEVAKGLYEAEMLYTYNDSADELVRAGRDSVPVILNAMGDPAHGLAPKRFMIWPLLRLGDGRPEVIQAIQAVATNAPPRSADRAYAERALRYLESLQPK